MKHSFLIAACAVALSGCAMYADFGFGPFGSAHPRDRRGPPARYGEGPVPQGVAEMPPPAMGPSGPPQGARAVVPAQPGMGTTIEHKPNNPQAYRCNADGTRAVPPNRGTGWCEPKG